MKTKLMVTALFTMLILGVSQSVALPAEVSFDVFYSSLSPYGEWVQSSAGYGWRPYHVRYGWRPYYDGRWVWTDNGWYWSSYEPFGWATYHYGRWTYDNYYGWTWIPGNTWGPAWVEWRYNDDYVGWAPLTPAAEFSAGIGITYRSAWVAPVHYWNFVPSRNFTAEHISAYVQPVERSRRIYGGTRASVAIRAEGDHVVNAGIDVNFVERHTNTRVNHVDIVENDRVGERYSNENGHEQIGVYRPQITGTNRAPAAAAAPGARNGNRIVQRGRPYTPPDYRQPARQPGRVPIQRSPQQNRRIVRQRIQPRQKPPTGTQKAAPQRKSNPDNTHQGRN
jgi:hypothetical protein